MRLFSNLWIDFRKRIIRLRIRTKFLFVFVSVIIFIAAMILIATTIISRNSFTEYSIEMSSELAEQIALDIEKRIQDIEEFTYYVSQNSMIKEYIDLSQTVKEEYELALIESKIESSINSILGSNAYFHSVMMMTTDESYFWWEKKDYSNPKNDSELINEALVKTYFSQRLLSLIPDDNKPLWTQSEIFKDEVLLVRPMIDEQNINRFLGYIIFAIDKEFLKGEKAGGYVRGKDHIAIMNANNELLIDSSIIDLTFHHLLVHSNEYDDELPNRFFIEHEGNQFYLSENIISSKDWKLICIIPLNLLEDSLKSIQIFILIIVFVSIIFVINYAFYISKSITKNIYIIEKSISKVEAGDFNIMIKPASYDEIGLIGLRINNMAKEIRLLIDRLYVSEVAKQKMETEVLKAQINPHFLYNTLGSIKWLALSKHQYDIANVVASLIDLLKSSIKKKSVYQTLEKEIQYIENYMEIQKISLDGEIDITYDIDNNVKGYYVLNFMLQPIVENSIYHGLELRKGNAKINIRAYEENGYLLIEVIDNGIGMEKDVLDSLLIEKSEKNYSGLTSIGLRNVNERIIRYFGLEYGISFFSEIGNGTKVLFKLPIKRELEE